MKILLTGSAGYIGQIIKKHFEDTCDIICLDLVLKDSHQIQCNIMDRQPLEKIAKDVNPDVVIHAVGNKNIGFCENNPDEAFRINCDTIKNIAQVFGEKAKIIYISTDYVFDGLRGEYTELEAPNPQTIYGKSKLCGEIEGAKNTSKSFIVIRLSALYDANAVFICYLKEKLSCQQEVECFSNIIYSPTYVKDFLSIIEKAIVYSADKIVFHACGKALSRFEFASAFAETFGFDVGLVKEQTYTNKRDLFLFPNLSMCNRITRKLLQVETTKLKDALLKIKQGGEG